VDEFLFKDKNVTIVVASPTLVFDTAAESVTVINQRNDDNTLDVNLDFATPPRNGADLSAFIQNNSISFNTGITQVNQDVGNNVNQINSVSAAIGVRNADFTESLIAVDQRVRLNSSILNGNGPACCDKQAWITDSVNLNTGVTMVNQNAGNANNQVNALDLAIGSGAFVALSEADLGQWNQYNTTDERNASTKVGYIINSVNGNRGVTAVNQSTGNFNNQGTVISFAGALGTSNAGAAVPTGAMTFNQ
jgi:hypothetical protein